MNKEPTSMHFYSRAFTCCECQLWVDCVEKLLLEAVLSS